MFCVASLGFESETGVETATQVRKDCFLRPQLLNWKDGEWGRKVVLFIPRPRVAGVASGVSDTSSKEQAVKAAAMKLFCTIFLLLY